MAYIIWEIFITSILAENWLEKTIKPSKYEKCGNHALFRKFSTGSYRFLPFRSPIADDLSEEGYLNFVINKVKKERFSAGGTETFGALRTVLKRDIPTGRGGDTNVLVFTDGHSNDDGNLPRISNLIKEKAKIYTYGIGEAFGEGANFDELNIISSDPDESYVRQMKTFEV